MQGFLLMNFLKRAWAEIDLDKAKANFQYIKSLASGRYIMPVVKADAYGHGADALAEFYASLGADAFAVSNIVEAIQLRNAGITEDILILGYTPVDSVVALSENNISQTVYSLEYAKALSDALLLNGKTIKVHLKLDTGMGRLGFSVDDLNSIKQALSFPCLEWIGVFTHFATADSLEIDDKAFSEEQFLKFQSIVAQLKENNFNFKYIHCCNSAATLLHNDKQGNLIRPGIILYGISPDFTIDTNANLTPIMSIKTVVSMVKTLKKGESVSYGRTFTATKDMTIATLPIGYADGYPRNMSNSGKVLINGKFANIIGRVCMDQMMIDITDIENISLGTEVTVIGQDNGNSITFADIASEVKTIPYELICNISVRMPRVYKLDGKITAIKYLGGAL